MNVLMVAKDFDLCEAYIFAGLARRGLKIEAFLDPARLYADVLESAGIRLTDLALSGRVDLRAIKILRKRLLSGNFDIVHSLTSRALSNSLIAASGLSVRHVTYRGTMGHLSRFDPLSWLAHLNPRVDKIVCVSNAVRDYLKRFVPERKLVTIYKGHDTSWYEGECSLTLGQFGIPEGAFVVACVANMRPVKGGPYLIEAVRRIPAEKNIHLLLVGRIEDDQIARMLRDESLRSRVHCSGYQSDAPALVAKCDAFVMPSVAREGLSKALIEAMSVSVPPIVTAVGGMPEVVVDGECGLVVPPRSADALTAAILRFYEDRERARRFGVKAKERIREKFNVERSIDETLSVYEQLLGLNEKQRGHRTSQGLTE